MKWRGASSFGSFERFFDTSHHAGIIIYEAHQLSDVTTRPSESTILFLVHRKRVRSTVPIFKFDRGDMTDSAEKKVRKDKK